MTPDEYQQNALRTASMNLGPQVELAVRALGLCGEASEFSEEMDPEKLMLEAGDILWYVAALAKAVDTNMSDLVSQLDFDTFQTLHAEDFYDRSPEELLCVTAGKIAEKVKKHVGHGKPLASDFIRDQLVTAVMLVGQALGIYYISLNDAAEANVAKLKARYPQGFDVALAAKL